MIRTVPISTITACFALLVTMSFSGRTYAESFRCGNKLALPGDTRMEVRNKCGEPGDIAHSTLIRRSSIVDHGRVMYLDEETIVVPVEVWTYNFGPHRFMCRLRFVDGKLAGLETMGYGYDEKDLP